VAYPRTVNPEMLDSLPASDTNAQRSRRDLQRVHRVMGTRTTLLRALKPCTLERHSTRPLRVLELGAGDGSLMLGVARSLQGKWPPVQLALLDRVPLLTPHTQQAFQSLGWSVTEHTADALQWAKGTDSQRWDLIVTTLFLHHFDSQELAALLAGVAARTKKFIACEPRRSRTALAGSHLIGAIGVNALTRHDAVLSVRAGFCAHELEQHWPPAPPGWGFNEYRAGLFSHCFIASLDTTPTQAAP
jgi:hypothetical protein